MIDPIAPDFAALPHRRPGRRRRRATPAQPPVVSILTPFFNTDEVFLETVESLRNQTFVDWEWIVVDDGSTVPDALARLAAVAASDPRIRVVARANGGPAPARNTAFAHSRGSYLCLIDRDVSIKRTYLETCLLFSESRLKFSFCTSRAAIFGRTECLWTTALERRRTRRHSNFGSLASHPRLTTFEAAGGFVVVAKSVAHTIAVSIDDRTVTAISPSLHCKAANTPFTA